MLLQQYLPAELMFDIGDWFEALGIGCTYLTQLKLPGRVLEGRRFEPAVEPKPHERFEGVQVSLVFQWGEIILMR